MVSCTHLQMPGVFPSSWIDRKHKMPACAAMPFFHCRHSTFERINRIYGLQIVSHKRCDAIYSLIAIELIKGISAIIPVSAHFISFIYSLFIRFHVAWNIVYCVRNNSSFSARNSSMLCVNWNIKPNLDMCLNNLVLWMCERKFSVTSFITMISLWWPNNYKIHIFLNTTNSHIDLSQSKFLS